MIKRKSYSNSISFKNYSKDLHDYKVMTSAEEKQLIKLYNDPNTDDITKNKVKQRLVEGHLRYALQVANKYNGLGMELEDVIAEANMGLVKAIDTFDFTRNIKFITHASYHVKGEILNALNNNARVIRLPMNIMHKLNREVRELNNKGKEMSDEMINLPSTTNLHRVIGEDTTLADVLKNGNAKLADYDYEFNDLVDYLLSRLDERSAKIVSLLYGLKGEQLEMKEIAENMDLNVETIRIIKNKAIEKLEKRISLTF
jgi:RNA polymerase primary sigma factor